MVFGPIVSASVDPRHEWRYIKCPITLHCITLHYIVDALVARVLNSPSNPISTHVTDATQQLV